MDAWLLIKRFFVADTIGGINSVGGWKNGAYCRQQICIFNQVENKLKIQLYDTQNEKIYPPYIEITYSDRKTDEIQKGVEGVATAEVTFMSENYMNTESLSQEPRQAMPGFWVLLLN